MEYHLTLKKKDVLPFEITWMILKGIILTETRHSYGYEESKWVKFILESRMVVTRTGENEDIGQSP